MQIKKKKILVIVDMQGKFPAANHEGLEERVVDITRKFKNKQYPIVLLEFAGYGKSLPAIRSEVETYHNGYIVKKRENDGSNQVEDILENHTSLSDDDTLFYVCGVNLGACVIDTATGLGDKYESPIFILEHYSWNNTSWYGEDISRLKKECLLPTLRNYKHLRLYNKPIVRVI